MLHVVFGHGEHRSWLSFLAERQSPPTPARERGIDCGLRAELSWPIELAAGQVLGATPCWPYLFGAPALCSTLAVCSRIFGSGSLELR